MSADGEERENEGHLGSIDEYHKDDDDDDVLKSYETAPDDDEEAIRFHDYLFNYSSELFFFLIFSPLPVISFNITMGHIIKSLQENCSPPHHLSLSIH